MKRKITFLLLVVVSISFFSCKESNNELQPLAEESDSHILLKSSRRVDSLTHWNDQVNYIKSGTLSKYLMTLGLKLLTYKVADREYPSISSSEISNASYVPIYENGSSNSFLLEPISSLSTEMVQKYSKKKEEILKGVVNSDRLLYLEFHWDYNGNAITTFPLVSEENHGIIYDDILSNIRFVSVDSSSAMKPKTHHNNHQHQSKGLKNNGLLSNCSDPNCDNPDCQGAECDDYLCVNCVCKENQDGVIAYIDRSPTIAVDNWLGTRSAEAWVKIQVDGIKDGTTKEILSYDYDGHHWANAGFSADASLDVSHFEQGQAGLCEYEWAIMAGDEAGLQITFVSGDFTLPAGAEGLIGGGAVTPSDLTFQ